MQDGLHPKSAPVIRRLKPALVAAALLLALHWMGMSWGLAVVFLLVIANLGLWLKQRSKQTLPAQEPLPQWASKVFDHSCDGILIANAEHRVTHVNQAFCGMTGFAAHDVIGHCASDVLPADSGDEDFYDQLQVALDSEGQWMGELWRRRKDGEAFATYQHISAITDHNNRVMQFVYIITDISEKKKSEEAINQLTHFDQLSGLPNRNLFLDRLQHAMTRSRRTKKFTGLMFIDLDRFKYVNDTLGHNAGDQLLIEVAKRLKITVREQDTVARLGGDEFTVVLEDMAAAEDAILVAEKIIQAFTEPMQIHHQTIVVGTSIGISVYPTHGSNREALIKNADTAMYQAKESGRNQFKYYTENMSERTSKKFHLESELRKALDEQHFELYYQAQVNLDEKRVTGAEALVRWMHPEQGMINPGDFIPLAEETGLTVPLGEWVLRTACHQAQQWEVNGFSNLNVSVNLSGRQLTNDNTLELVKTVLRESGLPADKLTIEITESAVMADPERAIEELNAIRDLGVLIAIDDFGTGYSSLSYLKRLPVSCVKIDRSFTKDVHTDKDDAAIVNTIVAMTNTLGLKVLAEGVEGIEHIEYVSKAGCYDMQGYYFSRPLPEQEFLQFVKRFNDCDNKQPIEIKAS